MPHVYSALATSSPIHWPGDWATREIGFCGTQFIIDCTSHQRARVHPRYFFVTWIFFAKNFSSSKICSLFTGNIFSTAEIKVSIFWLQKSSHALRGFRCVLWLPMDTTMIRDFSTQAQEVSLRDSTSLDWPAADICTRNACDQTTVKWLVGLESLSTNLGHVTPNTVLLERSSTASQRFTTLHQAVWHKVLSFKHMG